MLLRDVVDKLLDFDDEYVCCLFIGVDDDDSLDGLEGVKGIPGVFPPAAEEIVFRVGGTTAFVGAHEETNIGDSKTS